MYNYNPVIVESAVLAGLCLLATILCRGKVSLKWMAGAIGVFAVNKLVLFFGVNGALPDVIPGKYNWEGKIAGVLLLLAIGYGIFKSNWAAWGLTVRQNGPAVKSGYGVAAFTALATAAFMYLYFPGTKSEPTWDWLYQLTMPSLDEELLYRGLLLVMLERAFKPTIRLAGAPLGFAALITSLQFYATHIVGVSPDWTITIAWGDFVSLFYAGLWVYVRSATGSLLLPILLHSWANTANYLL